MVLSPPRRANEHSIRSVRAATDADGYENRRSENQNTEQISSRKIPGFLKNAHGRQRLIDAYLSGVTQGRP
jgi:hypothetical protein